MVNSRAAEREPMDKLKVLQRGVKKYTQPDVTENTYVGQGHFKIYRVLHPDMAAKLFGYKSAPDDFKMYMAVSLRQRSGEKQDVNYTLAIPLRATAKHIDVLQQLIKERNMKVATLGTFDHSFPALYKLLKEQREASKVPAAFQDLIQTHIAQQKKHIDIMGTQIEINALLKAGATIITCLMLYYMLNLRALVYKLRGDNQAYAVAWIGIYPDRVSYLSTLLTVIALPFAVSIVQLIVTFDIRTLEGQLISGATVAVLVIVSLAILVQSFKLFSKVKRFATRIRD